MKVKDFAKLYFGLLILHLAVIYRPESEALYIISKPALLFSLLAFFIHRTGKLKLGQRLPVIIALAASLAGDVLLMDSGQSSFLMGMGAFAIAQIAYGIFHLRQPLSFHALWTSLSVLGFLISLWVLYRFVPVPQGLQVYVYSYAALLGLHLVFSTRMLSAGFAQCFWPVLGALLFMVSDLILAYAQFVESSKYLHMAVMTTYALAQFGIAIGVLYYLWQNSYQEASEERLRYAEDQSGSTS